MRQTTRHLPGGTAPTSVPRLLSIEERVAELEALIRTRLKDGPINPAPAFDVEIFLKSSDGIAEFKAACRRLAIFNDREPLEALAKKTGGRMPNTEGQTI